MKGGRSSHHRPQSSDPPPDEWVDGSWTVDCICGVTFDDGEEMVKCDECGVWVHTRCSRYVKGEETFSCDKCKPKTTTTTTTSTANPNTTTTTTPNNHGNNHNNDTAVNGTEETEVAQFLIELPTKTISMENNNSNNFNNNSSVASRRPFKLWTEIPMEDRVHVQGIPGGDPSLFGGGAGGLSSIFGPQLWKCTGYVPKKFNFRYREFPSWNDEEDDDGGDGAGVLLSFSKETAANATAAVVAAAAAPVAAALVDMRGGSGGGGGGERKGGLKDGERVVQNGVKKERSLLRPFVVHSSKRKKEELGGSSSKDRSGKKRVRTSSEKEVDPRRRSSSHSSKTAFTPTSDAKPLEFYEDRGPKISKDDTRSMKNKNLKDVAVQEHISKGCFAVDTIMEEPNNNLTTTEDSSDPLFADTARHSFSVGDILPEERTGHKAPSLAEMPSKTDDAVTSVLKHTDVGNVSIKEKDGDSLAVDNADDALVVRSSATPHDEGLCGSAPEPIDNQVSQDSDCNLHPSSAKCSVKMKREDDEDNFRKLFNFRSSPIKDLKNNENPSDHLSDIVKVNDAVVANLPSCENKMGDVGRLSVVVTDDHKPDVLSGNFLHAKQEPQGSEGSMETQKGFSETKDGSDSVKDPHKMLACPGKSSPTSSTMNSKSLAHDFKSEDSEIPNSFTKHGVIADSNTRTKNESCTSDSVRDEIPRKSVRERPKSSLNANPKGLHSSRSTQNSVSKQVSSDARDSVHCSSSKASLVHQTGSILGPSETNASLHHPKALQGQHKGSSSVPPKPEKINQTNINPSSNKLNQNHGPSVNPSPASNSSMLSDEELALLLHQELNSSPRVPRVPRARHAGSLPQLTSASSSSMLIKRTSSVGGKDHCLVSRRKYKEASREGLCGSRELEDEAKRIEKEKVPVSSDQRTQDMACVEDASVKEEGHGSMTGANSLTNNVVSATSAIAASSPHSPLDDQNLPSLRNSPRNISDDDTASAGRPVHRTLPGLINDIMSKGRRMTYEELCNAVLPHWHNLRKHNGERYAYSSHSQAVLDCLRNRHEWARLVDRGPKTNSNRKRRKLDAEDSDDNGYSKGKAAKEVEGKNFELQKEDFPKGKRKARKRRRLSLQGRAVKEVRRRQKAESLTDEDVGSFSNSSEESMFSEDEIQVGRIGPAGSTSDEGGSA